MFAGTVETCQITPSGQIGNCRSSHVRVIELRERVTPQSTLMWTDGQVYLCNPRVNGKRGEWSAQNSLLLFPHGVAFDGISFTNLGHRTARVTATPCGK
jgi:hypothetical protein